MRTRLALLLLAVLAAASPAAARVLPPLYKGLVPAACAALIAAPAQLDAVPQPHLDAPPADVVIFGDSIAYNWPWKDSFPAVTVLNRAANGAATDDMRHEVMVGNVPPWQPKVILVLIGTNDIGNRNQSPDHAAANIAESVAMLRAVFPGSRILLIAPLPRGQDAAAPLRPPLRQIGALIARCADRAHIFYLDAGRAFLEPDGSISAAVMSDYLHPTSLGYQILARALRPTLTQLLADDTRSGG